MAVRIGLVGLPNVGKSTLFNALTKAEVSAENYPFCTIDPNVGVVPVPDDRLDRLGDIYQVEERIPTTVEFVDIAGLVKGASKGEGLGNQFLAHIREVDAIAHIVRCFEDNNITHVDRDLNPIRDIETIKTELCLADLSTVEKRYDKTERMLKTGDKVYKEEIERLEYLKEKLNQGIQVNELDLDDTGRRLVYELQLLTAKHILYVANMPEGQDPADNPYFAQVQELAKEEGTKVVPISAKIEADLAELPIDEAELFMDELGIEDTGLDQLIQTSYYLLNLITFFTGNEKEVHAWTVEEGSTAPEAAGKIHTDIQQGFIRAEVINFADLDELNSLVKARDEGELRLEGKDYIVNDGDVIYFRFNT